MYKFIILNIIFIISLHAQKTEKITLQLDWLNQFQFAGYYVAKEKGFYLGNSLDVDIKEFTYSTNLLDEVLTNKNSYAVGKSSLIIDRLNGHKISLLSAIYQNSPMVLLTLKKSGVLEINDLKNKKVMLTPDARAAANITSMIKSQNINLNEIDFIPHSFKLEDLISGKTDAMGCYLSNEPYILNSKGIEFNTFNPKDYGFNFYGGILFTSEEQIKNNPLQVKRFYEATLKGWHWAFENIEETAQLIYEKYNTQNKTLDSLIYEGKVLKKLALIDNTPLGHIDIEKIQEIKRLYLILGLTSNNELDVKEFLYQNSEVNFTKKDHDILKSINISLLVNNNNFPFSFTEKEELKGLEIDFLKLLDDKLPTNLNIVQEFKNLNIKLNNNIFIRFNHLLNDNIKKEKYTFSNTILKIPYVIATQNNSNYISSLDLLKNKTIAITKNSNLHKKLKDNYENIKFYETNDIKESLKLLDNNYVDAVIDNHLALSHSIIKNKYNNFKIVGQVPFNKELKIYTEKENSHIIKILNKVIDNIEQKEKDAIWQKYQLVIYKNVIDYSWIYKYLLPLVLTLFFIIYLNIKMRKEIRKRKEAEKTLYEYANKDSLTQIFNRRKIEKILNNEIIQSKKDKSKFCLVFFDIDDFKKINDDFGHEVGDRILISVSDVILNSVRKSDYFGRWGGEEFIIIFPNTSIDNAKRITENLRVLIETSEFEVNRKITASFGITESKESDTQNDIINRADNAMYEVKAKGKNAIKVS